MSCFSQTFRMEFFHHFAVFQEEESYQASIDFLTIDGISEGI
jgi:hypothetical protein